MEKIIQNILNLLRFNTEYSSHVLYDPIKENVKPQEFPLGAHIDLPDVRRIPASLVQTATPLPYDMQFDADDSMFEIYSQIMGTCVEETLALIKAYADYKETGKVTKYSRRFGYALTRKFSGLTEESGQGLRPSEAAKVATTVGFIENTSGEDVMSNHALYVNFAVTEDMRKLANINRAGGIIYPAHDFESVRRAIHENDMVAGQIWIDWGAIDQDGTTHAPRSNATIAGSHEVVFKGSVFHNGERCIKYRNSWTKYWGTSGYGYIPESAFEKVFIDCLAITDVPNDLVLRAKAMQYIFLTTMRMGSKGDDVLQLQKRLIAYGLLTSPADGSFGPRTSSALISYQNLKGLSADGIAGPKVREALNNDAGLNGTTKSKLDLWVLAIQSREGYWLPGENKEYPHGTPSYRNHNPGNMRSPYSRNVIGYDSSNFCIFPDYATGYMELRRMLENAATGLSKVYSQYMTLYQFFEKYAPKSDGNDPRSYAEEVARKIGVLPTALIGDLV